MPTRVGSVVDLWHEFGVFVDKTAEVQKLHHLHIPLARCIDDER